MPGRKPGSENGRFTEKRKQAALIRWSNLAQKECQAERMRRLMALPEYKAMMARRNVDRWARPGERERTFSQEMRQKIRDKQLGRRYSEATRIKHAIIRARYIAAYPSPETKLERILYCLLCHWGFHFEKQMRLGRCVVDAYIPSLRMVVEADGDYWHKGREKQSHERDCYLKCNHGVAFVWHLAEDQLYALKEELDAACRV